MRTYAAPLTHPPINPFQQALICIYLATSGGALRLLFHLPENKYHRHYGGCIQGTKFFFFVFDKQAYNYPLLFEAFGWKKLEFGLISYLPCPLKVALELFRDRV